MAKPEWGQKRACKSCGAKFYDFMRKPIACPKCEEVFIEEPAPKSRRQRSAARPARPAAAAAVVAVADGASDDSDGSADGAAVENRVPGDDDGDGDDGDIELDVDNNNLISIEDAGAGAGADDVVGEQ